MLSMIAFGFGASSAGVLARLAHGSRQGRRDVTVAEIAQQVLAQVRLLAFSGGNKVVRDRALWGMFCRRRGLSLPEST